MASVTSYQFKEGSSKCELFVDVPATSSEISLTHNLGAVPDEVVITPKTQYHVFESQARTDSAIYLTGTTGTSTCDVVVKKHSKSAAITETTA